MAIFRESPFTPGLTGSIGGVTARTGRSGPVLEIRPRPCYKNTAAQAAWRADFARVATAWRNLGDEQHAAWAAAAAVYPHTNRLGLKTQISGWNLYVKTNLQIAASGGSPSGDVPGQLSPIPVGGAFYLEASGPPIDVTLYCPDPGVAGNLSVLYKFGRSFAQGVNAPARAWGTPWIETKDPPTTFSVAVNLINTFPDLAYGEWFWIEAWYSKTGWLDSVHQTIPVVIA
jgi:hypothetical protein